MLVFGRLLTILRYHQWLSLKACNNVLFYCSRVTLGDEDVKFEDTKVENNVPGSNSSQTSTTTSKGARKRRQGATTLPHGSVIHLGSASSENVSSHSRATVLQYNESRPSTSSGSQGSVP